MPYDIHPSTDLIHVIEPLKDGPMLQSEYVRATRHVPLGDLTAALERRLLHSTYPLGGSEPVIILLPAGNELLRQRV
ncbi:MAG: hypothetical protein KGO96_10495 [Elusimicrobia bacterium]|nr:hypothetical protein [Elusimicrobiota bacterium]